MATDTERLILSLEAQYRRLQKDMDKANGIAAASTKKLEGRFLQTNAAIARSSANMSKQVARSYETAARSALSNTSDIKSALLGSASAIAASFGVREIANLADGYTRFTNQLKVAGLEGGRLATTQDALFGVAQKYGVELENLGRLYGGLVTLQKDLNTTSADSLGLTTAVAGAIKVSGSSSAQAAGAILGLNQALAQTRVQSDEYNQILDGARPLLLAAVQASDKYRGSLAKLKQDIEDGKVSGKDLFKILQGGFPVLAAQAEKASLTISNSFTVLNNALGKYIGETDQSLSATQRLSGGIQLLANNLDKIVPALTVIIGLIGVKYAASAVTFIAAETGRQAALVRSTLATEAAAAANAQFVASGNLARVTSLQMTGAVTGQAVAMGVAGTAARGLGASLLTAFGGPVGLAILAITAAVGGLIIAEQNAIKATKDYTDQAASVDAALRGYEDAALAAATATGEQAKQARAAAATARAEAVEHQKAAQEKLNSARASIALLKAEEARARNTIDAYGGEGSVPSTAGQLRLNSLQQRAAQANIEVAQKAVDDAAKRISSADRILTAAAPAASGGTAAETKEQKKARLAREKAARAAETAARKQEAARVAEVRDDKAFDSALRQAQNRVVDANAQGADVAEERVRLQTEGLEAERVQRNKEIAAEGPTGTKKFSAAETARLQGLNDQAAAQEKANVLTEYEAKVQRQAADTAADAISTQIELLQYQRDLADTASERRAVEKRILALQQQEERQRLQAIIDSKDPNTTAGDRSAARDRLAILPKIEKAQSDAFAKEQRDVLKGNILNAFEAARGGAKGLAEYFGDRLKAKLLDNLAESLANLIMGAQGGQGGGKGSGFVNAAVNAAAQFFGANSYATGTNYAPGGLAYVHKNELIELPRGSKVNTAAQTANMLSRGMPRAQNSSPQTLNFRMSLDLAGANGDAAIQRIVDVGVNRGVATALKLANKAAPGRQIQFQKLGK